MRRLSDKTSVDFYGAETRILAHIILGNDEIRSDNAIVSVGVP